VKPQVFDYAQAVDRNLGWLTSADQEKLRRATVAIAGVGGAGGHQAECLARLGVGRFRIADPDFFELSNFNRQVGSSTQTLGRAKTGVLQALIESINPEAEVESFGEGITEENIGRFLEGAGVVIDGIDFFALEAKTLLYEKARAKGIPLITACPVGFGATLIIFSPAGMDYKTYFDFRDGMSRLEQIQALGFGLSPAPLCLGYLNRGSLNLASGRAASVCPGLMLVGAMAATEAVRILAGKGATAYCPHVFQIDLFARKVKKKYYARGMGGPFMRLKRWVLKRMVFRPQAAEVPQ
jgi:molybdopterin/thiamine biosynthesis adenylyltransferase